MRRLNLSPTPSEEERYETMTYFETRKDFAMCGEREMPRYKCHKEVWALKIKDVIKHAHPDPNYDDAKFEASSEFQGASLFIEDEGYAPISVDADWYRKHNPEPGGYYVVYADGYKSYSPAKAFEEGYSRI